MNNFELATKFMSDNGVTLRTEYPDGFKGFRGYYATGNQFKGGDIHQAFNRVLNEFLDKWDEDNASEEEINYVNSICDVRSIKSFSAADDKPSFV